MVSDLLVEISAGYVRCIAAGGVKGVACHGGEAMRVASFRVLIELECTRCANEQIEQVVVVVVAEGGIQGVCHAWCACECLECAVAFVAPEFC